jgi:hypothetical protein
MTYLYRRGPGAKRRVMHLARYTPHGEIAGTWCGRPWNTSINVGLGQPRCKDCRKRAAA